MGTISSGIGLMSGLDIASTVEALMMFERRPQQLLELRVQALIGERTSFLELSAMVLAAKSAASRFDEASFFRKAKATSSDENVITATAEEGALSGSYAFTVHSLVTNHQLISAGFATQDATAVGAGTITLESAAARLSPETLLDTLNGGAGVGRGTIRITDRSGASTEIDLWTALTVDDVVDAINMQSEVAVTASVSSGHLVLTDETGQSVANLSVSDVGIGQMASDLGIAGSVAADVLTGTDVVYLADASLLSFLNDGNGVRRNGTSDDFSIELRDGSTIDVNLSGKLSTDTTLGVLNHGAGVRLGTIKITDRAGNSAEADLTTAQTMGDVQTIISGLGLNVSTTLIDSHLVITDSTDEDDVTGSLKIEDVDGGHAAQDFGIAQDTEESSITGSDVHVVDTLGDILRAINLDSENTGTLEASISGDGWGITLTDTSAGGGTTTVTVLNDSHAAEDLGILTSSTTGTITSRHLLAGLDTVLLQSLNGGSGVELGTIQLINRDFGITPVDLTGLNSVADVVDAINAVSGFSEITASINEAGNGLVLTDHTGGTGSLVVADVTGSAAADLNLLINASVDYVDSGNLQRQYINENTRLDELRNGQGVRRGKFSIMDSSGETATVDLTQGNEVTLGDVISEINSRGIGVVASINERGDGLLLTDTAGGTLQLTVTEENGTIAADLGILGTAADDETTIDGSLEVNVEIDADDTLNDVLSKINSAGADVQASVLNDGSSVRPYRMVLASELSGARGEMMVDTGSTGLSFSTLVEAQDAMVFMGQPGSPSSLMLTSSTNTLDDVVPKVRIDLLATSDTPVQVNVAPDVESVVSDVKTFVATFNGAIDKIEDLTAFDTETYERGILFGDATVERIRSRLYRTMRTSVDTGGIYSRMNDVGLSLGNGAKLQLDEDRLREALSENREDVEALFTQAETGLGIIIEEELAGITDNGTGLIDSHSQLLQEQEDLLTKRIEEMEVLLAAKEQRLYNDFYAMEQALAQMSSQQSALESLSSLTAVYATNAT